MEENSSTIPQHFRMTPVFFSPSPVKSTSIDINFVKIGEANQEKSLGTNGESTLSYIDLILLHHKVG